MFMWEGVLPGDGGGDRVNYVTMRAQMKHRSLQYLDSSNSTNLTSPGGSSPGSSSAGPSAVPAGGPSKSNAFSPAVVAIIGVLAGAFLIVSYYRIFLRYCNRHHISFWGSRSDNRNGGPSTIVLNMEEHTWPPDAVGLDESLISRIPTCKYKPEEGLVDGTECSVCLSEFEVGEVLRILPKCNHPFHVPCIDTWLATSSTCPLCRVNIVLAAAVPYALMPPVEREGPAAARGPTMALVPAVSRNPVQTLIHHEIEVLQEPQHGQEFLEAGQLSGPSSSRASSRASFTCAPDMDRTSDTRRSDATLTHHMRHLSLETDSGSTTTREIHVVTDTTEPPIPRPTPDTKRRLYRPRHASEGGLRFITDPKGKLPQTKRFARIMGSSSTLTSRSTAGSSSLNQVVVELLAQEIFQNNVSSGSQTESTIVETSVRSSRRARQDNASFEVMWSIHEQENPLMGSSTSFHNRDSSSEMIMEEDSSVQFMSSSDSDSEDGTRRRDLSRSSSSKRSSANNNLQPWPSKRHSLRDSMARLSKRCGSVNLRQKTEKVHTSEPVFEIFDF